MNIEPSPTADANALLDLVVVIVANAANLLLAGMFLARAMGRARLARLTGTGVVLLAIPLAVAVIANALAGRDLWVVVLPLPMIAYCAVEFLLDYVLKSDFRQTRLLGPNLLLYYAGLMALIGYAFLAGRLAGFVTLATYFVGLAATFYSFARVGHGPAVQGGASRGH